MVFMQGANRVLDKSITDSADGTERTLSLYGVSTTEELINLAVLVTSGAPGLANNTMKINNLAAMPIKVFDGNSMVDAADGWISVNQLYFLTFDGTQFIVFPLGASQNSNQSNFNIYVLPDAVLGLTSSSTSEEITTAFGGPDGISNFINALQNNTIIISTHQSEANESMLSSIFTYGRIVDRSTDGGLVYDRISYVVSDSNSVVSVKSLSFVRSYNSEGVYNSYNSVSVYSSSLNLADADSIIDQNKIQHFAVNSSYISIADIPFGTYQVDADNTNVQTVLGLPGSIGKYGRLEVKPMGVNSDHKLFIFYTESYDAGYTIAIRKVTEELGSWTTIG